MKTAATSWKSLLLILVLVMMAQTASAGIFSDISNYWKERSAIRSHSKNVVSGVRDLYRERKSIRSFTQSAATLVSAFNAIKDKKANIAKLLDIASSIGVLAREYQNLAPKASAMYSKVKPDLDYFSQLKGDEGDQKLQVGSKELLIKTFSESRVNKLAGAAGWSRVWDAISDNPMNIFRWGRLKDEYDYGKVEGKYVLKCTQIAFEGASYYTAAQQYMRELMGIQNQISALTSGDLGAILNINKTINSIQGAAAGVSDFGEILNIAGKRMGNHITDLGNIQNEYLAIHKNYAEKYLKQNASASSAASTTGSSGTITGSPYGSSGTIANTGSLDLQSAMVQYQKAYLNYTSVIQNSGSSDAEKNAAIRNLQSARAQYDAIKAALENR